MTEPVARELIAKAIWTKRPDCAGKPWPLTDDYSKRAYKHNPIAAVDLCFVYADAALASIPDMVAEIERQSRVLSDRHVLLKDAYAQNDCLRALNAELVEATREFVSASDAWDIKQRAPVFDKDFRDAATRADKARAHLGAVLTKAKSTTSTSTHASTSTQQES
jgi:hypothetical protein